MKDNGCAIAALTLTGLTSSLARLNFISLCLQPLRRNRQASEESPSLSFRAIGVH